MSKSFLQSISLENFMSFSGKNDFKLAPITILVGPNNSGKSTFISSIKYLHEAYSKIRYRNISLLDFMNTKIPAHKINNEELTWNVKTSFPDIWLCDTLTIDFEIFKVSDTHAIIKKITAITSEGNILFEFKNFITHVEVKANIEEYINFSNKIFRIKANVEKSLDKYCTELKKLMLEDFQNKLNRIQEEIKGNIDSENNNYAISYFENRTLKKFPKLTDALKKAKINHWDLISGSFDLHDVKLDKLIVKNISDILDNNTFSYFTVLLNVLNNSKYEMNYEEIKDGLIEIWRVTELKFPNIRISLNKVPNDGINFEDPKYQELKNAFANSLPILLKEQITSFELEHDVPRLDLTYDITTNDIQFNFTTLLGDEYSADDFGDIELVGYPINISDYFFNEDILVNKDKLFTKFK